MPNLQSYTFEYLKYLLAQAFTLAEMKGTGNVKFARKKRELPQFSYHIELQKVEWKPIYTDLYTALLCPTHNSNQF